MREERGERRETGEEGREKRSGGKGRRDSHVCFAAVSRVLVQCKVCQAGCAFPVEHLAGNGRTEIFVVYSTTPEMHARGLGAGKSRGGKVDDDGLPVAHSGNWSQVFDDPSLRAGNSIRRIHQLSKVDFISESDNTQEPRRSNRRNRNLDVDESTKLASACPRTLFFSERPIPPALEHVWPSIFRSAHNSLANRMMVHRSRLRRHLGSQGSCSHQRVSANSRSFSGVRSLVHREQHVRQLVDGFCALTRFSSNIGRPTLSHHALSLQNVL